MKNWFLMLISLSLAACTAVQGPAADTQEVQIQFAAEINGQAFECGKSYSGVGTTRSIITPSDFRWFVSEVNLITPDGKSVPVQLKQDQTWQLNNVALLDFENATGPCSNGTSGTNTRVRGTVPIGQYTGLAFTVGVPFNQNHIDPTVAPAPMSTTAMFWTWQGGYKFIKFDTASSGQKSGAQPAAEGHTEKKAPGFSVHLGSTMCAAPSKTQAPSACQNGNRIAIRLDQFDVRKHTVVLDMGRVLAQANVDVNAPGTAPGCMSFPKDADCPAIMGALGLTYDGAPAPGAQKLITQR